MKKRAARRNMMIGWFVAVAASATGASFYTETFMEPSEGWQDRDTGKMSVTWQASGGNPGGCIRGGFTKQAYPLPQNDGLMTTGRLTSAAFTGDYRNAGVCLLGFDFMAADAIPAVAEVRLYSEGHYMSHFFHTAVTATGVWHSFRVSLDSSQAERWLASPTVFSDIIDNVSRVEFVVNRASESAQSFYFDNIFVDALPMSGGIAPVVNGGSQIAWHHVRSGDVYRVEASSQLATPTWHVVMVVTAQTSSIVMDYDDSEELQFLRIVMP